MRLIDADAYSAEMKDRQAAAWKWRNEAIAEEDEVKLARAEGAYTAFTEANLTMDKHIINPWHRVEDELPESNDAVNVVWVNRNPESYYAGIKGKPFVATAHYHKGKWYWFSSTCKDFLDEYGRCEVDEVDKDIDILYWMPLPSPPVNKLFTK